MLWLALALATPADDLATQAAELARQLAATEDPPEWRWDQLRAMVDAWATLRLADDPLAPVGRAPLPGPGAGALAWTPWGAHRVDIGVRDGVLYAVAQDAFGVLWTDGTVRQRAPRQPPQAPRPARCDAARVGDQVWFLDDGDDGPCTRLLRHGWHDGTLLGEDRVPPDTDLRVHGDVAWLVAPTELRSLDATGAEIRRWPLEAPLRAPVLSPDGRAFLTAFGDTTTLQVEDRAPWTTDQRCTFADSSLLCFHEGRLHRHEVDDPTEQRLVASIPRAWPGRRLEARCGGATVAIGDDAWALRPCDVPDLHTLPVPPPLAPGPPRQVTGQVVRPDGGAAKKLEVVASAVGEACNPSGTFRCRAEVVTTQTDRKGRFALTLPDERAWDLVVHGRGWHSARAGQRVLAATGDVEAHVPVQPAVRVRFDAVPDTVDVLGARLPGQGELWVPMQTPVRWWGADISPGRVSSGLDALVEARVRPGRSPTCALAEAPDDTWPCFATDPARPLADRVAVAQDDGTMLLAPAPPTGLELPGAEVLAATLSPEPLEVLDPRSSRPRPARDPSELFSSANLPQGHGAWVAHVRTDDGDQLWSGNVVLKGGFQLQVTDRVPRPTRTVQVRDDAPVPYAAFNAFDPHLRQRRPVVADAEGRLVLPTDDDGTAWLAQGSGWVAVDTDTLVVEPLAAAGPPGRLRGPWRLREDVAFEVDHSLWGEVPRPLFDVGPGLWRFPVQHGHGLVVASSDRLVEVLPDRVAWWPRMGATDTTRPRASAPSPPKLPVLHHSEVEVKRRVTPSYPEAARPLRLGDQECLATVHIAADGTVVDVAVSSCPKVFHAGTKDALMKWVFTPPKIDGRKQDVQSVFTVVYEQR